MFSRSNWEVMQGNRAAGGNSNRAVPAGREHDAWYAYASPLNGLKYGGWRLVRCTVQHVNVLLVCIWTLFFAMRYATPMQSLASFSTSSYRSLAALVADIIDHVLPRQFIEGVERLGCHTYKHERGKTGYNMLNAL
jgi:hypothetical protein